MPQKVEKRKSAAIMLPLLGFTVSLVFRKLGWPFGPALVIMSGIWLCIYCLWAGIRINMSFQKSNRLWVFSDVLLYGVCFVLILFQQQYWVHGPGLSKIAALIFIGGILHKRFGSGLNNTIIWQNSMTVFARNYFTILLSVLLITGIFLNPKMFHNFYRVTTYEEFLRSRYPRISMEEAGELLATYNSIDVKLERDAQNLADTARVKEKQKDYKSALRFYNLAIDINPFDPSLYYQRGRFKISKLELNEDLAISAIIDFSESARMRPSHAESYFQRGVIYSYLDKKEKACEDMHSAYGLDSTIDVLPFIKKCCPQDSSRFIPLHP